MIARQGLSACDAVPRAAPSQAVKGTRPHKPDSPCSGTRALVGSRAATKCRFCTSHHVDDAGTSVIGMGEAHELAACRSFRDSSLRVRRATDEYVRRTSLVSSGS